MTAALVTTLNEAATIGPFVAALLENVDRVLVVDDPRTADNTEQVAHAFGADTLCDLSLSGIGPCLLAGFRALRGEDVVVIDAGGSHDPYQVSRVIQKGVADVVVGSRYLPGSEYYGRAWRKAASALYSKACSSWSGHQVTDWTSGFRYYSPVAISQILSRPLTPRMHGFQPAVLERCLCAGLKVVEQPIVYRAGRSSFGVREAREALHVLGGLRCSS